MSIKKYKVVHLLSYPIALFISKLLYFLFYLANNLCGMKILPSINTDTATLSIVIAINFYAYSCCCELTSQDKIA